jgi:spore germination cell wall hydrolase CwlJ-like protein
MRIISDFALAVVTIWQEARGEPFAVKLAVAEVIRNRMKLHNKNVCEVVLEPLQFSGWNAHDQSRVPSCMIDDGDIATKESAGAWLESATSDITQGATHFWNPKIASPSWAGQVQNAVILGAMTFGSIPNEGGQSAV